MVFSQQKKIPLFIGILLLSFAQLAVSDYKKPIKILSEFKQLAPIVQGQLDHVATMVFDHPDCQNCQLLIPQIQQYANENEGFTETYVVDCEVMWNDEVARAAIPMCDPQNVHQLPMISYFTPAEEKIKGTSKTKQQYYQGAASAKDLSAYLRKRMPSFRDVITNLEEYEDFLAHEQFENKVILFTNKEVTSPLYRALTSTFRDRLLFAEVNQNNSEVVEKFKIESYPTIVVLKKKGDTTEHETEIFKGGLKYKELEKYLSKFAMSQRIIRKPSKKESAKVNEQQKKKQEEQKKKNMPTINQLIMQRFENDILKSEKPVLVHITKGKDQQHPLWDAVYQKYQFLFEYFTFDVKNYEDENFVKDVMKASETPGIRYFPPGISQKTRTTITFGVKDNDIKEIHTEFLETIPDHTITISDDQLMQNMFQQTIQQQKVAILYLFEKEISLGLRVASMQEEFKQKFNILSYKNPSQAVLAQFQIQKLPSMVALFRDADLKEGVKTEDDEPLKGEEIKAAAFQGKFNYLEISNFLKMWIQMKQGGTSAPKAKVMEYKKMDDFYGACKGSSFCVIALFNGEPIQRKTDSNSQLNKNLELLNQMNDRYGSKGVTFGWIDGFCHNRILLGFGMAEDQLPSMITYNDKKKQYARMIGTFDRESIISFVEKTLKQTVSYQPLNFNDFDIKDVNCIKEHEKIHKRRQELLSSLADDNEEDDILKEILEEEKKKREALEQELNSQNKSNKKKKRSKRSKKKTDL